MTDPELVTMLQALAPRPGPPVAAMAFAAGRRHERRRHLRAHAVTLSLVVTLAAVAAWGWLREPTAVPVPRAAEPVPQAAPAFVPPQSEYLDLVGRLATEGLTALGPPQPAPERFPWADSL